MMNLDGQCQGGHEGENYRKLPGLVKRPKKVEESHRRHTRRRRDKKKKEQTSDNAATECT